MKEDKRTVEALKLLKKLEHKIIDNLKQLVHEIH